MNFFQKALKSGLTLPNIICWLGLESMRVAGKFLGTWRLRIKAACLGVKLGKHASAHGLVQILRWPGGVIEIGDHVNFISSSRRATAAALAFPARLRVFGPGAAIIIGDGCELSGVSITARSQKISIGKNVLIAPNCIIVDSDFHQLWPCEERAFKPGYEGDAPVSIEDYAWIGMNCIILKGVSIGRGAIIGAGSVVSRDVPAYCVAAGNPARITGKRAPEATA